VKAQAISRRPVTVEAQVRSQVQGMLGLWWTKWHCDRFFSQYFGFHLSVSFHWRSIQIICILTLLLSEGQAGEAWEPQNAMFCRISESTGQNTPHTAWQGFIMLFWSVHNLPNLPSWRTPTTLFQGFRQFYVFMLYSSTTTRLLQTPMWPTECIPLAFDNAISRF